MERAQEAWSLCSRPLDPEPCLASAPPPPALLQSGCCPLPSVLVGHALLFVYPGLGVDTGRVEVGMTGVGHVPHGVSRGMKRVCPPGLQC